VRLRTAVPRPPTWGFKTSLWQFRQPAFWLFLVLLALSGLVAMVIQAGFVGLSPIGWVLSWVLLLAYAIPVFLFIYALDLYEREPLSLVFGAFLWGAFGSTTLAIVANGGWSLVVLDVLGPDAAVRWVPAIVAPFTEEILKGIGVVFIYLIARREIDDLMDGFVYGAIVGLGFTIIEDVYYFIAQFGGTIEAVLKGFFVRVVASGLYGHVLYSGLFGMGVAYFVSRRGEASVARRMVVAATLILVGMGAHFLWNSPLLNFYPNDLETAGQYVQWIWATAVKGLPFLVFVILMIALARRREHRWLRTFLSAELGGDGVREDELSVLERPRARRQGRRELRKRAGPQSAEVLKRLHRAQINLALIRTRTLEDDHPDLLQQRQYCRDLRAWLEANTAGPPGP
jgi:RsiW-degrading membrane proteinase PrsW (M82 family)